MSSNTLQPYGDGPGSRFDLTQQPGNNDQVVDKGLLEYWELFRSNALLIIGIVLLGVLGALAHSLPEPIAFQAQTRIEIQEPNDSFLNIRDMAPIARSGTSESYIQTQIEVLQSEPLIQQVIERLTGQPARQMYRPDILSEWMQRLGFAPLRKPPTRAHALAAAARSTKVRNIKNTRIVEISAEASDPLLAAEFVNGLAEQFVQHDVETRLNSAQSTSRWLQTQIEELRRQLQVSEQDLQEYAQKSGLLMTSDRGNVTEDKLRQVQQELSLAQANRMQTEARYKIAQTSNPEALPDVLNDSSLRTYASRIAELRGHMADQRTILKPEHYKIQQLQNQINELQATFERERDQIIKRIRNDYDMAKLRESMLVQEYSKQFSVVSGQSSDLVYYNMLKREVETNRHVYESMLQKVKEANVASAVRASSVRVLNRAAPANRPHKPNVLRDVMIGLTSSLFLAVMIVALRDRLDGRLREPGDVHQYSIPELGVILSADKMLSEGRLRPERSLVAAASMNGNGNGNGSHDHVDTWSSSELLTWNHKPSVEAESFRTVLTSLLTLGSDQRVFIFTSPSPKEGKTTICANLAVALAEIERKVLVIDADLREPRIHNIFDVPNDWGFTDIAQERSSIVNRPLEPLVKRTQIPNLFVLPSGPGAASVFCALHSPRVDELLQRAREEFDVVLIDTPPMLGLPDARVLGKKADGVVLVFRLGQSTRAIAKTAVQRLIEDRVPVVGTILNDWKPKPSQYGYLARYYSPRA
ncbi:MAG TPA: polysaccharide biosynthesis tyrosine autokinase [Bryobacteraceae bacterium]|nr:polysaccharide biosynthesis tyrosine autokinase [Bryobacteraceae bacterium]